MDQREFWKNLSRELRHRGDETHRELDRSDELEKTK